MVRRLRNVGGGLIASLLLLASAFSNGALIFTGPLLAQQLDEANQRQRLLFQELQQIGGTLAIAHDHGTTVRVDFPTVSGRKGTDSRVRGSARCRAMAYRKGE